MGNLQVEKLHFVKGVDPVADAFSGTVNSGIVNLRNYATVQFVVYKGVGTTGTSTITVVPVSDMSATASGSAVPFYYKAITTGDTQATLLEATAAGFTTTAGSSQVYVIEIPVEELLASGYSYVRLRATEVVDSPVLGCILTILGEPRYGSQVTAIV
jgi:hypothetical protein